VCTLLTTFDGLTLVVAKILIKQNCPSFPQLSQYFMNLHRLLHEVTESTHKRDPSCHPSQRQFTTHLKYNSTSSDTQLDRVLEACLIPNPNRIRSRAGPGPGPGPEPEPEPSQLRIKTRPAPRSVPQQHGRRQEGDRSREQPNRSSAEPALLKRGACPTQARTPTLSGSDLASRMVLACRPSLGVAPH
jgi:hypothetical protein